ncbi:hypothetical protein CDD80_1704 [Ophiocordyceps camponoti-rufipedis]|uniref:Cyclin-like domain-containing protein n=1 Tax=Ophiocordyceps camponoti-rufipedis TaxID=2004952 RepID=A0A2C5YDQ5_9HYPO|nr:hypothetical protein CDD80_1704 [Ophiocordyceps camponoti-rufipedis]
MPPPAPPLTTPPKPTPSAADDEAPSPTPRIGPHPGFISSSNQYSAEIKLRRLLKDNGCDPAREDNYRLQGVQLIDGVREQLLLTFDTACTYYHKFRLNFRDSEYNYQDAALASLFVACKVEDTIKKSRDILAAAYNVKNPDKPVAADDKVPHPPSSIPTQNTTSQHDAQIFESPGKVIIGLERLILETIGFDFRTRYPQKLLVKLVRSIIGSSASLKAFFATAYAMCMDMYKTFVPIKRTTLIMVMAVIELTARLRHQHVESVERYGRTSLHPFYSRDAATETMLDLLDLYVQHHKSTKLGTLFDLAAFIDIKIKLNTHLDQDAAPRFLFHCSSCEVADANPLTPVTAVNNTTPSATIWPPDASIRRAARGQDGTMRFVVDPEAADEEQAKSAPFFALEFEDVEVDVEEPLPPPTYHQHNHHHHHHHNHHSHQHNHHNHSQHHHREGPAPPPPPPSARGAYRGGYRDRGDHGRWGGGGPYGGHRGDGWHHRGRGRHYY